MSYTSTSPSIMIAREGYAGLGAVDAASAASYCGTKFGVTSKDFQPCVDWYKSGKPGDYQPSSSTTASGSGSTLSQVGSFFGNLLGGAINSYAAAKGGAGAQPVVVPSGPPPWLVPVAIGGIGIMAILLLRRPRRAAAAPTSNPARRRRRSRRRLHARRRRR